MNGQFLQQIPGRAPLFTRDNAAEMARRSNLSRKAKMERLKQAEKQLAEQALSAPLREKQARVELQLIRLDGLIDKAKPKDLNGLIQAKERLLNVWALLTGFPRPGIRKTSRNPIRGQSGADTPQPVVPSPDPDQP